MPRATRVREAGSIHLYLHLRQRPGSHDLARLALDVWDILVQRRRLGLLGHLVHAHLGRGEDDCGEKNGAGSDHEEEHVCARCGESGSAGVGSEARRGEG